MIRVLETCPSIDTRTIPEPEGAAAPVAPSAAALPRPSLSGAVSEPTPKRNPSGWKMWHNLSLETMNIGKKGHVNDCSFLSFPPSLLSPVNTAAALEILSLDWFHPGHYLGWHCRIKTHIELMHNDPGLLACENHPPKWTTARVHRRWSCAVSKD